MSPSICTILPSVGFNWQWFPSDVVLLNIVCTCPPSTNRHSTHTSCVLAAQVNTVQVGIHFCSYVSWDQHSMQFDIKEVCIMEVRHGSDFYYFDTKQMCFTIHRYY